MLAIHRSRLPTSEAALRAALADYRAALEAHRLTVDQPAPWPAWEILRDLAAVGDFSVVDDEYGVGDVSHNEVIDAQIRAIESRELAPRFSREGTLINTAEIYALKNGVTLQEAVANLLNPAHPDFSQGFAKLKALDDAIRALRQQRQP